MSGPCTLDAPKINATFEGFVLDCSEEHCATIAAMYVIKMEIIRGDEGD